MKACVWIAACAVAIAGYALADPVDVILRYHEILPTRISRHSNLSEQIVCYLDNPTGETLKFSHAGDELFNKEKFQILPFSPLSPCAVNVHIDSHEDEGVWRLHYKTNTGETGEQSYRVVFKHPEDQPLIETTTEKEERTIEYLNGQIIHTALGRSHEVRINYHDFVNTESCHIITPNGEEYNLEDEDAISAIGIKALKDSNTACGVELTVQSERSVGRWALFSRDTRHSNPIERRLKITIIVEENVRAVPSEVTISTGSDLYVRLENPTPHYETCKLSGPDGMTDYPFKIDPNHRSTCGFIVPDVQMNYTGRWEIVYGNSITYRAAIQVKTNAPWDGAATQLEWLKDRPVHIQLGPDHAVYCRMSAPEEVVVFESFGRCNIKLDRATEQHSGTWSMVVGLPGRVLTEQYTVTVHVTSAAPRPQVITQVESQPPAILITCAIQGDDAIRSCKFVDPSGKVLMASHGVGEDRYSFHGVGVSLESNVSKSDCGLRITNPVAQELGIWRCSVVSHDDQVYHGFLRVVLPWVTAELGAVVPPTEPTLTTTQEMITAVEGDAVTMSCSIQSVIHYCYFRTQNGTIISVSPRTQSAVMQYIGAGFDAGECGVRLTGLQVTDSGPWSCHAGLTSADKEEQRATFNVHIQKAIVASQRQYSGRVDKEVVEAWVHDESPLDYCRFVRNDGFGFGSFTARLPDRVTFQGDLSIGLCSIHIEDPIFVDRQPWTVVARITGQDVEVSASTDHQADVPPPPPAPPQIIFVRQSYTWLILFMMGLSLFAMGLSMSSKDNRKWVHQRATTLRNSFRKQPLSPPVANNTAFAA